MSYDKRINTLLDYSSDMYPITTLYLKLGPSERANFKYKTNLKYLIKNLRHDLDKSTFTDDVKASVERDLKKITNLADHNDKLVECRGVCVFSSTKNKLWRVFKLPVVYRDQLAVDRSPLLGQLIKINNDYKNIVTIVIDRKKARIFRVEPNGVHEILDFLYPDASRTQKFKSTQGSFNQRLSSKGGTGNVVQGYGEHSFNRTIENETHQHYKYVADKIFDYYNKNKFDFQLLGGTEKNVTEFSHHLHSYLQNKVVGTITADVNKVKVWQVAELSIGALEKFKAKKQKKTIKEFEGKIDMRYAVNGIEPTLKALARAQVKTLLVEEGFSRPGFICPETKILSLVKNKSACPEGIEPLSVVDIINYAIEESTRQKSEVEILTN